MEKSRQQAMAWWSTLDKTTKQAFCDKFFTNRNSDYMTSREVEQVHKRELRQII